MGLIINVESFPTISIVFYSSRFLIIHKYYTVLTNVVLGSQTESSVALCVPVEMSRLY